MQSWINLTMHHVLVLILGLLVLEETSGLQRRCFECRSRGELGSCRDPFPYNVTQADAEVGVRVVQCASGWCGKMMEGGNVFKTDDYGVATQRMCLQRGPSDSEERCAYTLWSHRKVYMCFCNGDVCNSSRELRAVPLLSAVVVLVAAYNVLVCSGCDLI